MGSGLARPDPKHRRRERGFVAVVLTAYLVLGACGSPQQSSPEQRAVVISTQACGHASKTSGSGVIVSAGEILTAAHVVVGASTLTVVGPDGAEHGAAIVRLDTVNDLAVLEVPGLSATAVELAELEAGDQPTIVGGASSGSLTAEVRRRVIINVDEIRGTERNKRAGYELLADIDGGDSGAGVFDDRGRLAAIVFAAPTQRDGIAWVTGAEPIAAVLGDSSRGVYACDPDVSRVVASQETGD